MLNPSNLKDLLVQQPLVGGRGSQTPWEGMAGRSFRWTSRGRSDNRNRSQCSPGIYLAGRFSGEPQALFEHDILYTLSMSEKYGKEGGVNNIECTEKNIATARGVIVNAIDKNLNS